jgi:hypothetical protein
MWILATINIIAYIDIFEININMALHKEGLIFKPSEFDEIFNASDFD